MYKFIFFIGAFVLMLILVRPYNKTPISTKEQQLSQIIDQQVHEYDKAQGIYKAIQAKNDAEEIRKAEEAMKKAATTARKARLDLCTQFNLLRAAGGYNVKAQSCKQYE